MRPYKYRKFEEWPDVGDIKSDGRSSHVGTCSGPGGKARGYNAPAAKAKTRRHLKRADKAKIARELND